MKNAMGCAAVRENAQLRTEKILGPLMTPNKKQLLDLLVALKMRKRWERRGRLMGRGESGASQRRTFLNA